MNRWLIWLLIGVGLCGCQMGGGPVSDDCPAPDPCDDTSQAAQPLFAAPGVTLAAGRPLWPGCPSTLQVMARPYPIVFRAVRPEEPPETDPDPSDWVCGAPDAPLLRAGTRRTNQAVASR
jgi:hypothetical protein